jgi:hypothetical protein
LLTVRLTVVIVASLAVMAEFAEIATGSAAFAVPVVACTVATGSGSVLPSVVLKMSTPACRSCEPATAYCHSLLYTESWATPPEADMARVSAPREHDCPLLVAPLADHVEVVADAGLTRPLAEVAVAASRDSGSRPVTFRNEVSRSCARSSPSWMALARSCSLPASPIIWSKAVCSSTVRSRPSETPRWASLLGLGDERRSTLHELIRNACHDWFPFHGNEGIDSLPAGSPTGTNGGGAADPFRAGSPTRNGCGYS